MPKPISVHLYALRELAAIDFPAVLRTVAEILQKPLFDGGSAMRRSIKLGMWLATVAVTCGNALAEDTLQQDFLAPSVNAKPAVWWFWGETVTTDHGITQDLEALKRVGFGGVVIYEQTFVDRAGRVEKSFAGMAGKIPVCRGGMRAAGPDPGSELQRWICRRRPVDHPRVGDAAPGRQPDRKLRAENQCPSRCRCRQSSSVTTRMWRCSPFPRPAAAARPRCRCPSAQASLRGSI